MKSFCRLFLAVLVLGVFMAAEAQRTSVPRNGRENAQREQLRKLMSRVGVDVPERAEQPQSRGEQQRTYRELKIRWSDSAKQPAGGLKPALSPQEQTEAPSASIVEEKRRSGALPRNRSLELSPTQIFIAAVDATNKLRWWSIVPDPRIVRSETQTATGEMRGEDYYVSNVTLVVAFPDDPEITNLRFYHPVWNGTDFNLKPLTTVPTR
jgi:hypothetical protein